MPMTSQDAIRRFGEDGYEEDEFMNDDLSGDNEDDYDDEQDDDSGELLADQTSKQIKKAAGKSSSNQNAKKRDLRNRKTVDYNEEKCELGKRAAVTDADGL